MPSLAIGQLYLVWNVQRQLGDVRALPRNPIGQTTELHPAFGPDGFPELLRVFGDLADDVVAILLRSHQTQADFVFGFDLRSTGYPGLLDECPEVRNGSRHVIFLTESHLDVEARRARIRPFASVVEDHFGRRR